MSSSSPSQKEASKSTDTIVFAVLDLPSSITWSIDGKSITAKRDDFLGFDSIPHGGSFHLITLKHPNMMGITQGFALMRTGGSNNNNRQTDLVLHKYNPQTEEVSPVQIMDTVTRENFLKQTQQPHKTIGQQRIISYQRMHTEEERTKWREATLYITTKLLRKRGVTTTQKIVPHGMDDETSDWRTQSRNPSHTNDGSPIRYPPIPCIDPSSSLSLHQKKHVGTKLYLAKLSPAERTNVLLANDPGGEALEGLLQEEYHNNWKNILGDLQFAFVAFLQLQCFASLQHWRDTVSMLSMISRSKIEAHYEHLYINLVTVLTQQLHFMEAEFFEDVDLSDENFLEPAMKRLVSTLCHSQNNELNEAGDSLWQACLTKFSAFELSVSPNSRQPETSSSSAAATTTTEEDRKDIDHGAVVVSMEEYEASLARSSVSPCNRINTLQGPPSEHKSRFPILFAAILPHEDVLMTCARALDEQVDVSLVREAAEYLEEVEANRG